MTWVHEERYMIPSGSRLNAGIKIQRLILVPLHPDGGSASA